jgi:hypothetical protein
LNRERIRTGFRRLAKPALAGLLAVILLILGAISVSHALHEFLHHDASDGSHFCLLCSIAKGQVSTAALASTPAPPVLARFCALLTADVSTAASFDYRLSPSRAPPLS